MSTGAGYALQFTDGYSFVQAIQNATGEFYARPILEAPTVAFLTTDATTNAAAGSITFTPASMTNIKVGVSLLIDRSLSTAENVIVDTVTGTTFTATCKNAHNGTATAITVEGMVFSFSAPTGTPAPSAGKPARGWSHFAANGTSRSWGLEVQNVAGQVFYPGGTADRIWGLLLWCVTATEVEVNAH